MRARGFPAVLLLLVVGAAGCGGSSGGAPPDDGLPTEPPDVMILSVAGHGGVVSAIFCTSDENVPYLGEPGGAVEALAALFQGELGATIAVANFSDRFVGEAPGQQGFLELERTLEFVFENWIEGRPDDPTRIVLVAHSHGTVWAHIAASVRPDIPIDYLITLDGICSNWECEHTGTIRDWVAANGDPWPWDIADPCGRWVVPGVLDPVDTKDLVPDGVGKNLEVRSNDLFVFDAVDNVRPDGGKAGIETYLSSDSHTGVDAGASDGMTWVLDRIRVLEGLRAAPAAVP